MFKPHIGICKECGKERLIPTKNGLCIEHNEKLKKEKKSTRIRINEPKVQEALNELDKIVAKKKFKESGFKPHRGICSCGCDKEGYICVRKGYIQECNERIKKEKKKLSPRMNPIVAKVKKFKEPTGELKLFKMIWESRPHRCEVCGKEIKEFSHNIFSHILSKGSYGLLRLDENNIWIMCYDFNNERGWGGCHLTWEHHTNDMKEIPMWKPVFELADQLKQEANNKD